MKSRLRHVTHSRSQFPRDHTLYNPFEVTYDLGDGLSGRRDPGIVNDRVLMVARPAGSATASEDHSLSRSRPSPFDNLCQPIIVKCHLVCALCRGHHGFNRCLCQRVIAEAPATQFVERRPGKGCRAGVMPSATDCAAPATYMPLQR
jgi:hypothetical protein